MIFLFANKEELELGKVFSTLALLGYVFNFSILYSNYAIEALYSLQVIKINLFVIYIYIGFKQKDQ